MSSLLTEHRSVLVLWGGGSESGNRFDATIASVYQAAADTGIRAVWLRSADLRDREHFRSILQSISHAADHA